MKRISITPRKDYIEKLEALSFKFHSLDNIYWDESAYYSFNVGQVNELESATNELYGMCLKAVQYDTHTNFGSRGSISRGSVYRSGFGSSGGHVGA